MWRVFAYDLQGQVIITVAANPYSLPPYFRKLPLKLQWSVYTSHYSEGETSHSGHLTPK